MYQIESGERVGAATVLDDTRPEAAEFEEFQRILTSRLGDVERYGSNVVTDYEDTRETLATQHAERSRSFIEGEQTANGIRRSTHEVTEYIDGLASELYVHFQEAGMPDEEIARKIDRFVAMQTQVLLSEMAESRSQLVRSHHRFIPKFVGDLYDKFTEKWRSWEVPKGDGELVSRLRETGMWQHLEQKTAGTTRGAKLGRFALTVISSSVNGVENLKYSGARKRLYTMAGIGMLAGATAGVGLGFAGAGAFGIVAGAAVGRSAISTGIGAKLNRDASIEDVALYDQVRIQGGIKQLSSEASVGELLGYVSNETEKMIHQNNVKLMSGMAIGLAAGLVGNAAARSMSWIAGQYIDANFNVTAHAEGLHTDNVTHVVNGNFAPNHVIDGSSQYVADHVIDGESPNHVINGYSGKLSADHVVDDDTTPNHVINGSTKPNHVTHETHPNHVIDGSAKATHTSDENHPNHVIDGNSTKEKVTADTFYVESGHGFINEIQDYAKANGYGKIKSAEAFEMHKLLLKEHGKNGLIDVHGIKQDTYVENGDVRISAAGKAHWRTGVEHDLESLMDQHARGDKLTLSDSEPANHVTNGNNNSTHPNHVIDGNVSKSDLLSKDIADYSKGRDESIIAKGEGGYEFMRELGTDAKDREELWNAVAPKLDDNLTYRMPDGEWRLNMTPDHHMPVSAIETAAQTAQSKGIETDYTNIIEASSSHLNTDNSFTANQFSTHLNRDMRPYYDALKGIDPRHKADVLSIAAHDLQSFKLTEKVGGVWRFREVNALPPKAADLLSRIADKHNWTLAA
ncbi:hypothetical protein EYC58_03215 [Candidatus Saccharibacteria bacterium]|nr:MAG: hypothetical protein EYC58_03215 [Candidatus Saccharibacteria bacterium]